MSEVLEGQLRSAVDQVIPMVPDLASRRLGGLRASPLERRPDTVQQELVNALGELGVDANHPDVQSGLPKMECYTLLGAVNTDLYPTIVDGHGAEARFKPALTSNLKRSSLFSEVMLPVFQDGYHQLANTTPWVQTIERHYPAAYDAYVNPSNMSDMDVRKPIRDLELEVSGGDLGTTVQELVRLARKLEVQAGDRIPEGASDDVVEKWLLRRRQVVEKHLAYFGLSRATINIGNHANGASMLQPLSHLEGSIVTVRRGDQEHTSFRRQSVQNMREVYPRDESLHEGPTLKCPFRHGELEGTDEHPLSGYLYAGLDLAYNMGYFMRTNDERAKDGFPDLEEAYA